jgi:hypothetical protein
MELTKKVAIQFFDLENVHRARVDRVYTSGVAESPIVETDLLQLSPRWEL